MGTGFSLTTLRRNSSSDMESQMDLLLGAVRAETFAGDEKDATAIFLQGFLSEVWCTDSVISRHT